MAYGHEGGGQMRNTFTSRTAAVVVAATTVVALGACSSSGSAKSSRRTTSTSAATTTTTAVVPKVTVAPTTGLHDGQGVDVTATGFPPNTQLAVQQCADKGQQTTPGDCDLDKTVSVTSDVAGIVHTSLRVTVGPFGTNKVTCAPPQRCLVLVEVVPGRTGLNAFAPITFGA